LKHGASISRIFSSGTRVLDESIGGFLSFPLEWKLTNHHTSAASSSCSPLSTALPHSPSHRGHDVVAQTRQHGAENRRILHAVAATSHATLDDLVEEMHRVETDGMVR
jgi:hypothetical protein